MIDGNDPRPASDAGQSCLPAPGSELSNTDPTNRQNPQFTTGGVDYLEVSAYVYWSPETWENLSAKLEGYRELAQQLTVSGAQNQTGMPVNDEYACIIKGHGIGSGIRCRYGLERAGITFGIVNRREFGDGKPNVRIFIKSDTLMVHGHQQAWENAVEFLRDLGGEVVRATVSRLDVCADLPGVGVSEFVEAFHAGKCVRRAKDWHVHGHGYQTTGLSLGKSVMMRIYDKLAETESKPDKRDIMVARRWGGVVPDAATRVEFQFRGEQIKNQFTAENTVENVFAALPKIADWSTSHWFRLTDDVVDRDNGNQARAGASALWQTVCQAFERWTGENCDSLLAPVRRSAASAKRLTLQAFGCMAKAAALVDAEASRSVESFLDRARRLFAEIADTRFDVVKRKARDVEILTALGSPVCESIPF